MGFWATRLSREDWLLMGAIPSVMIYNGRMSHLFAYLSRMKFIRRWGLMRNTYPENIQEHSLRVAMIAHALAIIRNRVFNGSVNPERTAVLALYHDANEVLTGDLPTPVKNFNPVINAAYKEIESAAALKLFEMVPDPLKEDYRSLFIAEKAERESWDLVKAADKLCAYIKCLEEISAGNLEFAKAERAIRTNIEALNLPEAHYFLETFAPSFRLTLDELD
jgi:5'-deoxynucleotidase